MSGFNWERARKRALPREYIWPQIFYKNRIGKKKRRSRSSKSRRRR